MRGNRDTLSSSGVFDLETGPVTITLPMRASALPAMLAIDQDEYSPRSSTMPATAVYQETDRHAFMHASRRKGCRG
jgi:Protein of unknown function (DUF1254)